MVEAFAIHTDNGALGDKGPWVDIFDDLKDRIRLALFSQHEHHFLPISPCKALSRRSQSHHDARH